MMYIDPLSSFRNPLIKELLVLQESSKERKAKELFIVEGIRELESCINGGYRIDTVLFSPDLFPVERVKEITCNRIYSITSEIYSKIAYRGDTEGVIAIVNEKKLAINDIKLSKRPLVIVLESVEKPGNLGAVLRTADAAKVDAVIICDPLTDLYNPNIIRSSIGGIFTNQVCCCSSQECYEWLNKNNISILTAEVQAKTWYHKADMTLPVAIVMGSEADGLTKFWTEHSDTGIKIPMNGKIDSLNVSVSTAIICFEALRQRDFIF